METIVIAATITGTAAIIAAGINAIGNISAAKHKAAVENPAQKEIVATGVTLRTTKADWSFRVILYFISLWWFWSILTIDLAVSRYLLALIILAPSVVVLMIMAKFVTHMIIFTMRSATDIYLREISKR